MSERLVCQEGENSRMKKSPKKGKKRFPWIVTGFFLLCTLAYLPKFSGFIALAVALLLAPISIWQDFIGNFVNRKIKVLVAILLIFAFFGTVPTNETVDKGMTVGTDISAPDQVNQESVESLPVIISDNAPMTESTTPPTTEPATEPTTAPTTVPTTEATTEPITECTTEPTTEPTTAPTSAPTKEQGPKETEDNAQDYVLNTNTKKFHYPSCSSADDIKKSNRKDYHGTREEVIDMGYEPCKRCHP